MRRIKGELAKPMKDEMVNSGAELDLCAGVVADRHGAAEEFFSRYYLPVLRKLIARCTDGRSRSEAEEIVEDLFADCFRDQTDRNLLRYYSGKISLENWLCKVAHNRLKNWWRSGRYTYERQGDLNEGEIQSSAAGPDPAKLPGDQEVYELLGDALLAAGRSVRPRDLAMTRAYYLQRIPQVDIAKRWRCSSATVCRSLKRSVAVIREEVERYLHEQDTGLTLTWRDLRTAGTSFPEVLVGFDARGERRKD